MGTHYETLGVKVGATTQEIRKAYLRRARALHPDRQLDRPDAEARKAEQAMQQVNVAWNVLSDPTKKREYDKTLKKPGVTRPASRSTSTRTATPPQRQRPSEPARQRQSQRPSIDEEPGDGSVSVWASMPVLLVLGLLLGILILTAFAGDAESVPEREPNNPAVLELQDCFMLVAGDPREVSCASGTADGQVVDILPDPGNCPANTESLRDPRSDFYLCWARMVLGSSNTVAPANS